MRRAVHTSRAVEVLPVDDTFASCREAMAVRRVFLWHSLVLLLVGKLYPRSVLEIGDLHLKGKAGFRRRVGELGDAAPAARCCRTLG